MSSKLDQMRDQFRQRLALRSVTTSKCDLNRDHNQNIVTTDCSESEAKSTFTPSLTRNASEFPLSNKLSYSSNFKHQSLEPKNRNPVQLSGGSAVKPTVHKSQTKRQNKCLPSVKSRSERIGTSVIKREPKLVNQVIGVSVIGGFGGDGTPCRHCGRSFALTERLVKHESVCDLSNNKSRKTFDSMQQRFKGLPKEYFESYENTRNVCLWRDHAFSDYDNAHAVQHFLFALANYYA